MQSMTVHKQLGLCSERRPSECIGQCWICFQCYCCWNSVKLLITVDSCPTEESSVDLQNVAFRQTKNAKPPNCANWKQPPLWCAVLWCKIFCSLILWHMMENLVSCFYLLQLHLVDVTPHDFIPTTRDPEISCAYCFTGSSPSCYCPWIWLCLCHCCRWRIFWYMWSRVIFMLHMNCITGFECSLCGYLTPVRPITIQVTRHFTLFTSHIVNFQGCWETEVWLNLFHCSIRKAFWWQKW